MLHISKVAVGCASVDALDRRQRSRLEGEFVPIITRFRPKRAEELIGGSIYWIVKHRIMARQTILGFADCTRTGNHHSLAPELLSFAHCKARPSGCAILAATDAPSIWVDDDGTLKLPPMVAQRLAELALI